MKTPREASPRDRPSAVYSKKEKREKKKNTKCSVPGLCLDSLQGRCEAELLAAFLLPERHWTDWAFKSFDVCEVNPLALKSVLVLYLQVCLLGSIGLPGRSSPR